MHLVISCPVRLCMEGVYPVTDFLLREADSTLSTSTCQAMRGRLPPLFSSLVKDIPSINFRKTPIKPPE
jgi:hypothetical protein